MQKIPKKKKVKSAKKSKIAENAENEKDAKRQKNKIVIQQILKIQNSLDSPKTKKLKKKIKEDARTSTLTHLSALCACSTGLQVETLSLQTGQSFGSGDIQLTRMIAPTLLIRVM